MVLQIQRIGLCIIIVGCLAWGMTNAFRHHNQSAPIPPLGKLTAQQALQQSEQLCDAIAPTIETWNLTVERRPFHASNWWYVSCADANGQRLVHLEWNADTMQLFNVSSVYTSEEDRREIRNDAEAIRCACCWMRTLPFAERAAHWRVISVQQSSQKESWTVVWGGESQRAAIQIDAHTGDLRLAMCRRLPDSRRPRDTATMGMPG